MKTVVGIEYSTLKVMKIQFLMWNEMQICIEWYTVNSCTCYELCSIHRIEVASRRNLFFCRNTGMVVDCVIDCNDKASYTNENCALVGYNVVISGNLLPIGCPETSVRNYHYSLPYKPHDRNSHLLRGGRLKCFIRIFVRYGWG